MGKYDKYTDDFLALYKEGLSIRKISEKTGINKGTISRILQKHIMLRPKSNIPQGNDDIYNMYIQGYSIYQICLKYKCDSSIVKKFLSKKYNLEISNLDNLKYQDLMDNFKNEYINGCSLQEISDRYSVSKQTILTYLEVMKIPIRSYEVSSRSFNTIDNYFDNIDSEEKAYILGMLYATSELITYHNSKFLNISIKKECINDVLLLIQKFTEKGLEQLENEDKSDNKRIRVYSSRIYDRLNALGMGKTLPVNNIDSKYLEYFFKGLYTYNLSITKRALYINCKKTYKEDVYCNLKNLNIKARYTNLSIIIENNNELKKFVDIYPFSLEYIKKYSKENQTISKWKNFIEEFSNIVKP